jgi:peptidoglycan hydrolase-like protein with peptidoglycan-binding domain
VRNFAHTFDTAEFGSAAAARALMARVFGNPRDAVAILVALAAAGAILVNALQLQPGPHPAPMFAVKRPVAESAVPASPLPRPRPAEAAPAKADPAARPRAEIIADIQRELTRRSLYDGPVDGVMGPKTDSAIRDFEVSAALKATGEPSEEVLRLLRAPAKPVPLPQARPRDAIAELIAPSQRVLAVQRALGDFGYGPLKATGIYGLETVAAIEKFERERKLPVTGQITPRLMRELAALTGRPLE